PRCLMQVWVRRRRLELESAGLAAGIRIDRLVGVDIRRLIAADDRARRLGIHERLQWRQRLLQASPAVIDGFGVRALEPAFAIRYRAPSGARLRSEERRVGNGWRPGWAADQANK